MKKLLTTLAAAAAATALFAAPASAGPNPAKTCAALAASDPEAYAFIATKPGACQSSVASVGVDALMNGAFPSNAAAVGNCKTLEATAFQAFTPEDGRAYPYQFYWDLRAQLNGPELSRAAALYDAIKPQLIARNRSECVAVLRRLHSGIMGEVFGALPPGP